MWEATFTVAVGAAGYLLATFYFRPVLRYLDLKSTIVADLVLYANALPQTMASDECVREAKQAYRRHAAALSAAGARLPGLHRWWRARCYREDPHAASRDLIGMSNSPDLEHFERHRDCLYRHLNVQRIE